MRRPYPILVSAARANAASIAVKFEIFSKKPPSTNPGVAARPLTATTAPASARVPTPGPVHPAQRSDFSFNAEDVLEKVEQLPAQYIHLSGSKAVNAKLTVTDNLLHSVAVIAYPFADNPRRFRTLRLSAAGWNQSPENMRHNLAMNEELTKIGAGKGYVFESSRPVGATRSLIARLNGVVEGEADFSPGPSTAKEEKVALREKESAQAQASNEYYRMAMELLNHAVKLGTADIHLFVRYDRDADGRNRSLIQFRLDGEIVTIRDVSVGMLDPVKMRAMVGYMYNDMCSNKSEPQFNPANMLEATLTDRKVGERMETIRGRFKTFDLGDAVAPNGDRPFKMVLRIIYVDRNKIPTLESLHFASDLQEAIQRFHYNRRRLICVSGKVGMGKSTTLRSVYAMVPDTEAKYSVEEPIENLHPNTAQINVSTAEAMDRVLRGLKRGDLDSLLMGEVRSRETLELVINIVLSGHPCYSTTHSDSALGQIPYFLTPQMGMDSALLAHSAVLGLLMHQVLLKKVCDCRLDGAAAHAVLGADRLHQIERAYQVDVTKFVARRAEGCDKCRGQGHSSRIGYFGRRVIAEYFEPDIEDRSLIEKRDFVSLERRWRESRADFSDLGSTKGNTVQEVGLKAALSGDVDLLSVEHYCGRFQDAVVLGRSSSRS